MPKFAVAHVSLYTSKITTEVIEAVDWQHAIMQHSKVQWENNYLADLDELVQWKEYFFDGDELIDVVEITSP